MDGEVRVCRWCFKDLVRKPGETVQNFAKREHCDKRCAAKRSNELRKRRRR